MLYVMYDNLQLNNRKNTIQYKGFFFDVSHSEHSSPICTFDDVDISRLSRIFYWAGCFPGSLRFQISQLCRVSIFLFPVCMPWLFWLFSKILLECRCFLLFSKIPRKVAVLFLYLSCLNEVLWPVNLFLNVVSHSPIYFLSLYSGMLDFIVASYTMLDVKHFWSRGHYVSFFWQLQHLGSSMTGGESIFLLWESIIDFTFDIQP